MNKFTISTITGWIVANLTALYALPSAQTDDLRKDLKDQLTPVGQKQLVKHLARDLRRRLFGIQLLFIHLFNLSVIILIVLTLWIGPDHLLGRFVPEAKTWALGISDKWVFGLVLALPWIKGCRTLYQAHKWLKQA